MSRTERRYEVCWVDHPNRRNDECNIQTYIDYETRFSDGSVALDSADSVRRQAEMRARGYMMRWQRPL